MPKTSVCLIYKRMCVPEVVMQKVLLALMDQPSGFCSLELRSKSDHQEIAGSSPAISVGAFYMLKKAGVA